MKASSERKKYEFVFDKVVFLFNKGNGKNEKVRTKLHVSRKNFKLYTEKTLWDYFQAGILHEHSQIFLKTKF